ncbi:hypothetical protein WUBG_15821 [Wuchereria bancrofti]|uniref:Uncharacterized protein n=1 Tax=Wuchereria bancrofti TaxID=6293 RepID=J9DUD5_WUCBA|nr:hypothetical protein WUBG_15821 [Wuchereria bancrofti]
MSAFFKLLEFLKFTLDELIHGLSSSSPIAEPGSSSPPSASESPMLRVADVEMKESGHKMAQNDEDMETVKNTGNFADNVLQSIAKDIKGSSTFLDIQLIASRNPLIALFTITASDTFEHEQLGTQSLFNFAIQCGEASMETEPCSSASSVFSENKVKKNMEKWVPVKWMPKIAVNREICVEHTMASFLVRYIMKKLQHSKSLLT